MTRPFSARMTVSHKAHGREPQLVGGTFHFGSHRPGQARCGLETFLPLYRERRGGPDKPFFSCYLFARFEYERSRLGELRWTPGLRRIIAFEDRPAPVPDQAIRLLQERLAALPGGLLSSAQRLRPGERVRITQGPLASLEGLFEGTLNAHDRVAVLLDFIRQNSRVVVPVAWVERAGPPTGRARPPRRTRGRGRRIKGIKRIKGASSSRPQQGRKPDRPRA